MASVTVNGNYAIYILAPSGSRRLVKTAASAFFNCVGLGSPDGAISTTATPEKWNYLPPSADVGGPGYSIEFTLTPGANKTLDASDGVWVLPVNVNGEQQTVGNSTNASGLGNNNFVVDLTPTDSAIVAGVETPIYRLRAKEGVYFRVGGDKVFGSWEDSTA